MASKRELQVILTVRDQLTQNLERVGDTAKRVGAQMTVMGAAISGAAILAVRETAKFESAMSDISTLISGDSTEAIDELSSGIQDMLSRVPRSAEELGASAYAIVSAGIGDTAEALTVLENSAKLATAGLGTTEEATDIMTSAINAFGLEAEDAGQISDILFKTVAAGKTNISQLSQAFGATASVVASAGVNLEEFSAATAALTTTGLPAAQAQNAMRAAIISLQKPTEDMSTLFSKLGVESGEELIQSSDNIVEAFFALGDAADGNNETLARAFGSVEALNAVLGLTGGQAQAFASTLKGMTDGADQVSEAFEKQMSTFNNQFQILKNTGQQLLFTIGEPLLEVLTKVANKITPLVQRLAQWAEENPKITQAIVLIVASIGGLLVVLGPLIIFLGAVASAMATLSAVSLPITGTMLLIAGAIAGLIAVGVLLIKNWDKIKAKALEVWNKIQDFFANAIKSIVDTVNSRFGWIISFIKFFWSILTSIFRVGMMILIAGWKQWIENIKLAIEVLSTGVQAVAGGLFKALSIIFKGGLGLLKKAWDSVFGGLGETVKGVFEGVKSGVVAMINFVIRKINSLIDGVNKISSSLNKLPGVNVSRLSHIPELANGGIVTSPTLAMVGEGGEPEAVVPLSKANDMGFGGGSGVTINIYGDVSGRDLVDKVEQAIANRLRMNQRIAI